MTKLRPETRALLRALWLIALAVLAIPCAAVALAGLICVSAGDLALTTCGLLYGRAMSADVWWRKFDARGRWV